MKSIEQKATRFVGLDVHAETSAVAIAEKEGEVHYHGTIPIRPDSVKKLVVKLSVDGVWQACYEAGPTGFVLY